MQNEKEDLKNRLSQQAQGSQTLTVDRKQQVKDLFEKYRDPIVSALPKHYSADRFMQLGITVINQNPQLLQCTSKSMLAAMMMSAQSGLEPILGQCYFIPFRNNKQGCYEVQWVVGYKGLIKLAYQSSLVKYVNARVVREGDLFEYEYGLDQFCRHKEGEDRSLDPTHFYAVIHYTTGGKDFLVFNMQDIERIKSRSKGANKTSSPWNHKDDWIEMAKKSVLRSLLKSAPLSPEIIAQIDQDETVKSNLDEDMTLINDEFEDDPETPEGERVIIDIDPADVDVFIENQKNQGGN